MKRHPKRGFHNRYAYLSELTPLNLDRLMKWIIDGRIDTSKVCRHLPARACALPEPRGRVTFRVS